MMAGAPLPLRTALAPSGVLRAEARALCAEYTLSRSKEVISKRKSREAAAMVSCTLEAGTPARAANRDTIC